MRLPWFRISAGSGEPNSGSNDQREQYPATSARVGPLRLAGWPWSMAVGAFAQGAGTRPWRGICEGASVVIKKIHAYWVV